jgi:TolB-like protein/lipopolysaccharide biosynthesis regulator YciM
MSLFNELKRRNVFRVGIAYVVVAWLVAQVLEIVLESFGSPDWVMKTVLVILAAGMPFALIFAWAFELTPEGIKKERDVDRAQSITHHTGRKLDRAIIVVLVLALGYFIYESRFSQPLSEDNVIPDRAQRAPGTPSEVNEATADQAPAEAGAAEELSGKGAVGLPDEKSIAVLPFVNMSSDPEQEYFSDGISEEILNALARIEDLKVAGRTSSFAFKGQNQDLKTIGEALRVAHILEGSVRKAGNQLRITAQLIKVDDGYHMWSDTYDREMTDVFAIQDEISNAILVQLKAKLLGEQPIATRQANPEAYAQYLLAKQRIYERSQASLELAASMLQQATVLDPGFAAAYAQLGIATLLLSEEQYGTLPHERALSRGKQYLEKALALDPLQAEALAGMGLFHMDRPGGNLEAIEWFEKSLASDPNQANASNWLANALRQTGQLQASLELRERDFARDPLYMPVFHNLVQLYVAAGRHDKAFRVLADLEPYLHDDANMLLTQGVAYQVNGQWAEADRMLSAAHQKEPRNFVNNLWLSGTLNSTAQYERSAAMAVGELSSLALSRLGRTEEAVIAGHETVSKGRFPGGYFHALVESGRHASLIEFVEARWTDLAAFEKDWPERGGWGAFSMSFIAEAYGRLDIEEKFSDALERARASNDAQLAEGADNWSLSLSRAHVAAISGDYESAITLLERAFDQGWVMDVTAPTAWPAFRPLNGDPRYETAKSKMLEHMNAERAALGLEPLTT